MFSDHLAPPSPTPWKQPCSAPQEPDIGNWDIPEDAFDVSGCDGSKGEGRETSSMPESSTPSETSDDEEKSPARGRRLVV